MAEMKKHAQQEESSNWWWFDRLSISNKYQKRSPWLYSTLSELDEKTKAMLKLIEEDADSFAQRAEMYYKKRPELIAMVEDFYRSHRSLAERYDQFKSESGTRLVTIAPWASPLSVTSKCRSEKLMSLNSMDKTYDSYSETYETEDFGEESDVEDPEPEEDELQFHKGMETKEVSTSRDDHDGNIRVAKLMEEIEGLKEENNTQKEQLMHKDEEKREAIRQLSLAMELLREENMELKKRIVVKDSAKRQKNHIEVNKLEGFWRRLFN